jgi:hypothetical protein
MSEKDLDEYFSVERFHSRIGASASIEAIRRGAREFASVILRSTPSSADQTAAVRKVREAAMFACEGL